MDFVPQEEDHGGDDEDGHGDGGDDGALWHGVGRNYCC